MTVDVHKEPPRSDTVLKESRATLVNVRRPYLNGVGRLYLTRDRLVWKRSRLSLPGPGPTLLTIPLDEILRCEANEVGLRVVTSSATYPLIVREGFMRWSSMFNQKAAEAWPIQCR
jgi:hypothetical protein